MAKPLYNIGGKKQRLQTKEEGTRAQVDAGWRNVNKLSQFQDTPVNFGRPQFINNRLTQPKFTDNFKRRGPSNPA